ncbi:MAG TPA: DUF1634 domain-containing protein [Gemmatimonadales bacterium]|nr:DUF1634 domain-containing protein [Gemmatimonadales bacterium]
MKDHAAEDHAVEQVVGRLLQVGVLLAAGVTLLGGVVLLAHDGGSIPALGRFAGEPADHSRIGAIVRGALSGDGAAIVQLGVLLLIATPIARVAFTLVAFLRQRDRFYALVTTIVLGILVYSLLAGSVM